MLEELEKVPGGREVLPFVLVFHLSPTSYLWEVTHNIVQGEGGEQGDPFMPLLFAFEQHPAVVATQSRLEPSEKVFAFLDIYFKTKPSRVEAAYTIVQQELWDHCEMSWSTQGKRRSAGIRPEECDLLERIAHQSDPDARVWKGGDLRELDRVFAFLEPSLAPVYVEAQLEILAVEHQEFLDRILLLPDLQCAWSLFLHCASARAVRNAVSGSPVCTMKGCAGASAVSWTSLVTLSHRGSRTVALSSKFLVGWASAAPPELAKQRSGAVGRTQCTGGRWSHAPWRCTEFGRRGQGCREFKGQWIRAAVLA